ncbi:MAG: hypothetical protein FWH14_03300 [Oscillospiraceae bacterium]|nr:hypothetical protein [Oscillospiraceae bacterium]
MKEKIAYLRGLLEGLDISPDTNESKIYNAIAAVLDEIAATVEELAEETGELYEIVDEIDEDLGDLESEIFDQDDCDCDCDQEYFSICPSCQCKILIDDENLLFSGMDCPDCGETLEFEFEDDDIDEFDEEDE